MKPIALVLGVVTILLLDIVLATGNGDARGTMFHVAIELLPYCVIPSSVVLAIILSRAGHRTLASLFIVNLLAYAVIAVVLLAGRHPAMSTMFILDVLQGNLYLYALARHWDVLRLK